MASVAGWLRPCLKRLPELLEKAREGIMSGEPNGVFERERRLDDALGDDGEVKLWSAFTGQELLPLDQHPGGICSLGLSPDEQTLATSCALDGREGGTYLWLTADGPEAGEAGSAGAPATQR